MGKLLIISSKIKKKAERMKVSGDFADALNSKVESLIKEAVKRAKANGRKTVQAKDI